MYTAAPALPDGLEEPQAGRQASADEGLLEQPASRPATLKQQRALPAALPERPEAPAVEARQALAALQAAEQPLA